MTIDILVHRLNMIKAHVGNGLVYGWAGYDDDESSLIIDAIYRFGHLAYDKVGVHIEHE
jgi:hypothetical protein